MIGLIYPIPVVFVDRLFDGKTKVFVKFLAHTSTKAAPRHKVIFYASNGPKKLVGEGTIRKVEFLTPERVLAKYKDELFLNEAELSAYVKRSSWTPRTMRDSKEMLTLVLRNLRKYSKPIEYNKPITMAGQYLTAEEYDSLMKNQKGEAIAHS